MRLKVHLQQHIRFIDPFFTNALSLPCLSVIARSGGTPKEPRRTVQDRTCQHNVGEQKRPLRLQGVRPSDRVWWGRCSNECWDPNTSNVETGVSTRSGFLRRVVYPCTASSPCKLSDTRTPLFPTSIYLLPYSSDMSRVKR